MKSITRMAILMVMCGLCCMAMAAQDTMSKGDKPKAKAKEAAGMSMPMPKPAPEMTKMIKMMAGNWKVSEKMEPGPMSPNGGTGQGTSKLWAGPGNMSLMETYHSTGAMGNFSGAGTFWWDPKANLYHGVWCDNMTPAGCDSSGSTKWEGDNLVGTMEGEMNGQKMMTRFVYSDFKPDSFVMTMESGPDASKLQKVMTFTYTRAASPGKM